MIHLSNALERLRTQNDWVAWKRLGTEGEKPLREMTACVQAKGVGLYEAELFRKDMIGMMAEGKARGESLGQIFGGDIRAFSDSVAQNIPRKWRGETLLCILHRLSAVLLWFAACRVELGQRVSITPIYLAATALLCLVVIWSALYRFRFNYLRGWRRWPIILAGAGVFLFYYRAVQAFEGMPVLFTVSWPVLMGVQLALFIAARWAWCRYINGWPRGRPRWKPFPGGDGMFFFTNALERLRRENNGAARRLKTGSEQTLREMTEYVRARGVGMYDAEVFRKDMIGLMLEAAARGEKPDEALGVEQRGFCDSVVASGQRRPGESGLYMLYNMASALLLPAVFQVLLYRWAVPVTPAYLIMYAYIGALGLWDGFYAPRFALFKGWRRAFPMAISLGMFIAYYFVVRAVRDMPAFFTVNWAVLVGAHLLFFIIVRLLWNRHINRAAGQAG